MKLFTEDDFKKYVFRVGELKEFTEIANGIFNFAVCLVTLIVVATAAVTFFIVRWL